MIFSNPINGLDQSIRLIDVPFGTMFLWRDMLMLKRKWTPKEPYIDYKKCVPAVCIFRLRTLNLNEKCNGDTFELRSEELVTVVGLVKETRYSINL